MEIYNKDAKRFNDKAASRKDELLKESIVDKIIHGGGMTAEEATLYGKNKSAFEKAAKEKREKLLEARIVEKLALDQALSPEEMNFYTKSKKSFDERAIGLRAKKQPGAEKPPPPYQPPLVYVDRLPSPEPKRESGRETGTEVEGVYFEPIPRIPFLMRGK